MYSVGLGPVNGGTSPTGPFVDYSGTRTAGTKWPTVDRKLSLPERLQVQLCRNSSSEFGDPGAAFPLWGVNHLAYKKYATEMSMRKRNEVGSLPD